MDLTTLGPAGAAVAIVFLFLKFLIPVIDKLTISIDHNTKVTQETFKFMKGLNGELKKAAQKKLEIK